VERKIRVLFVAEAVTLAHVARPFVLASALDPNHYAVHFAHCPRYSDLLGEHPFVEHHIDSIPSEQFLSALSKGKPVYTLATLSAYVEEDLKLIEALQPDLIVGDFRLSLGVSAELAGVPYINITNACWSPYTQQRYTVPELPLTRLFGIRLAQVLFSFGRPLGFALHCLPMYHLRRRFGLKSVGFNLSAVYTHADYVLFADLPSLYKTENLPASQHFIGPVIWSPKVPLPAWWAQLPQDRPLVYVTLGSSGQANVLPRVIAALGRLDITAIVSTAGGEPPQSSPDNVYLARYLPGEEAAKMASLVICNGGSPTTYQALSYGVPVIGLAGNLDQYLNMATVEKAGAGRLLRAGTCQTDKLAQTISEMLLDPACREAAMALSLRIGQLDSSLEFNKIISGLGLSTIVKQAALRSTKTHNDGTYL